MCRCSKEDTNLINKEENIHNEQLESLLKILEEEAKSDKYIWEKHREKK